ncbi:MAG: hypothetical protein ABW063_07120 [Caulobacter sp.]
MKALVSAVETVRAHMLLASLSPCTQSHLSIKALLMVNGRAVSGDAAQIEALAREIEDGCSGYEPLAVEMLQLAAAVRVFGNSLKRRS